MSSFVNKIANSVTNKTGILIGRENLQKLTNTINQSLFVRSKYRDFIKHGNTVQLISKSSHMSVHICQSPAEANRLVVLGNGQIGLEATNAFFVIDIEPKTGHLRFKNGPNFLAFDKEVPCIMSEPANPKHKHELIRARNEFRLHEVLGSDEHFSLESVYFAGRYLAILPDGSVTTTRNKAEENAHFCIHVINVLPQYVGVRPQSVLLVNGPQTSASSNSLPAVTGASASGFNESNQADAKKESAGVNVVNDSQSSLNNHTEPSNEVPPSYSNLFPQLPK